MPCMALLRRYRSTKGRFHSVNFQVIYSARGSNSQWLLKSSCCLENKLPYLDDAGWKERNTRGPGQQNSSSECHECCIDYRFSGSRK